MVIEIEKLAHISPTELLIIKNNVGFILTYSNISIRSSPIKHVPLFHLTRSVIRNILIAFRK